MITSAVAAFWRQWCQPRVSSGFRFGSRSRSEATLDLFSNRNKTAREKMVVRAFLRCLDVEFSEDQLVVGPEEPVDISFKSARFSPRSSAHLASVQHLLGVSARMTQGAYIRARLYQNEAYALQRYPMPCDGPRKFGARP
ncbi:DUF1780 family protein [Rhizobium leguminosarum]|nr:DUF1780 family protein [Rhizobium leguminosarum]MBY5709480.1 DUF1780 family protein [Rhizobium leguminosarum]MBY5721739.1 DUF1780 family protein [Rhizobium leguminosarum]